MKIIISLLFIIFYFSYGVALAAPAWPFPISVKQPDGTFRTVLLHGDEHHHWTTTLDGIVLSESSEPSPLAMRAPTVTGASYFPHNGTPRVLVILAAFPDCEFTLPDPQKSFNQCLNGTSPQEDFGHGENRNVCSVAEYFTTVSHGQYTPLFDVAEPVMLPDSMALYGTSEDLAKLCQDACQQLVANNPDFDFTPYDNNNDGKVDMVYIVHAGYGENMGGEAKTMWARCGTVNVSVNNTTVVLSGCHSELAFSEAVTQNSFGGIPQMNGTGVLIHEFSHGMGLPDIYATTNSAQKTNNQSMQRFDVMDVGCYNGNSWAPATYNAWEQEAMGWLTIEELGDYVTSLTLTPIIDGGTAYKIQNPLDENEYIILENIQKRGINRGAYSHGLLAYHFAYAKSDINMNDAPNNVVGSPRVAVIPAGGLLISSYLVNHGYTQEDFTNAHKKATFPGTLNITSLTDESGLPNFKFYTTDSNGLVGHSLYNITEDTYFGTVTFSYDMIETETVMEETTIDFAGFTEETNLENTTIDNVYYNLDRDNGDGYNVVEGCLVINTTTDMGNIINAKPGSPDIKSKFAGIILKVDGSGNLKIDCQTLGNSLLNVRIGDLEAETIVQNEQGIVTIEYNVKKPTYVYLYTTASSSSAPNRASAAENAVKIYSLELIPGATGIESLSMDDIRPQATGWYSLDGHRLSKEPTQKGIYICKGKKVIIK